MFPVLPHSRRQIAPESDSLGARPTISRGDRGRSGAGALRTRLSPRSDGSGSHTACRRGKVDRNVSIALRQLRKRPYVSAQSQRKRLKFKQF